MSSSVLGGRYRLEASIGTGGMAQVFRGFDTTLDRTVAIKILAPQFARDPSFVERFRREAQAAARLNHPNIVNVYDTGVDGDTNYIVMEHVEGRTLAEYLSGGGRLAPVKAAEIGEKVAEALAAAHAQGVIHRDIKPANIMVTRDGRVKVMDFGIARLVAGPDTVEQTAAVLGTAAYLSPEQAQGQSVDARSDLYSLGVVLYEMLAGRAPFTGDSAMAVAYKHVQETPLPPSSVNADVPPSLDAVVMRALAKNPANRYQNAVEFREDLRRVIAGQDVEATPLLPAGAGATQVISRPPPTAVLPPTEPDEGNRKVWMGVLIGALILLILGGGAYLLAQNLLGDDTKPPVAVPNVVGESFEDASAELIAATFTVAEPIEQVSEEPPGTVLEQDPAAGDEAEEGSEVTLTIAKAPRTFGVPDLTGRTIDEATLLLSEQGLELGDQTDQESDSIDAGLIISQDPPPDEEVTRGTPVDVVVSTGPAEPTTVVVPDVTCLSFGQAKAQLTAAGLQINDDGVAPTNPLCSNPNKIAAQDPLSGDEVPSGTVVNVYFGDTSSPSAEPT